ncbi:MAG: insulinase family protein [Gemmatimonadaceae bacterium]|nr:insulinase family protein [Gemmatimonadaceae bacterium]MCW5826648.1 insulinase family protein [Gemmatimonadaceae bacterium]
MTSASRSLLPAESVRRERLPNGLTVLIRRDSTAPVVAIVTWVKAGYFDEPDSTVGIAHAFEHMYFKGTPTRGVGEIARATKLAGGYLNAGTIYDHTHYYAVLPASGFVAGLEVQADAYANSVIDAGELRRELEVIIEETKRKADSPAPLALETMFELLHDRHRIRRWRMGREAELRALTRDDLLAFYRNYYRPSNTVLAIVGDVDPDVALAEAVRCYGHLADAPIARKPGPQETEPASFRVREWAGDIAQTELVFGWRTPGSDHPDAPVLDLLGTVLAGGRAARLTRATRDRRLVSSISAYNYTPTEIGVFVVHASAAAERAREAARTVADQLRRVRDGDLSAGEVDRAHRLVEAQWLRRLESAEGQANFLGSWELVGGWQQGIAYRDAMLAADAARLTEVANRWLDLDRAALVAYRPRTAEPLAADAAAVRALLAEPGIPALPPTAAVPTPKAPPAARATHERVVDGIHVFRTPAGIPILVKPRPGAALAHVGCFIAGGVVDEVPQRGGLSTLMARTMLRGTVHRDATQLAEAAERLGGTPATSVGTEAMQWTLGVPTERLAEAATLLAELVLAPTFPEDGLEAERTIALASLGALRDDMYRQPMRLAAEVAWPDHPYGRSTLGSEESVRALGTAELRDWHTTRVLSSAAVVAVVGDVDPQRAADVLATQFAGLRAAPRPNIPRAEWPAAHAIRVDERDRKQTALALFFDGPARDNPARFDAEMLGGVASGLGGRFFEELRDRQSLAYTVMARPYARAVGGTFAAYIATSASKEEIARAGLLAEFAKFREDLVAPEELERARRYAIGAWQIRQASGAAVLGELADAFLWGRLEDLTRYPQDLAAVTPERMRALAARWFDPSRRVEGVVRGRA